MANIKINDLPVATAVQDTDKIVVSQGTGETDVKSSTLAVLRTWINSGSTDSGTVTANNGLTETAGNIQLGGALTGNIVVDINNQSFEISSSTQSNSESRAVFSPGTTLIKSTNAGVSETNLQVLAFMAQLSASDDVTNNSTYFQVTPTTVSQVYADFATFKTKQISLNADGMYVLDELKSVGLVYEQDYAAAGTLNDRWIPDYGAVKAYVNSVGSGSLTVGSGLTNTSGTIALGGTLSQNTTVDNSAHSFVFTNDIKVHGLTLGTGANGNSSNVAFGNQALASNVTGGQQNTAIGQFTMTSNTTGAFNTGVGAQALSSVTTGSYNTGVGNYALTFLTTTSGNTAVGNAAMEQATGSNNTALGFGAGGLVAGSGNVFLGYLAGNSETGSNKLYIANSLTSTPLVYGDFSTSALTINGTLSTTGQLTTSSIANNAAQTSATGSAGSVTFSQPEQGISYKKVIIYCNAFTGTVFYTFPVAFTNAPTIMTTSAGGGPAPSSVTSLTTTSVTLTMSSGTTTGYIELIGY